MMKTNGWQQEISKDTSLIHIIAFLDYTVCTRIPQSAITENRKKLQKQNPLDFSNHIKVGTFLLQ